MKKGYTSANAIAKVCQDIILIEQIIYNDSEMKEKNIQDVENKLKILFSNKIFIKNLKDARNNWLGIPINEVLENILDFIQNLEEVQVDTNK